MTDQEETDLLLRIARQMFGPDVTLHPDVLERARQMFRLYLADISRVAAVS